MSNNTRKGRVGIPITGSETDDVVPRQEVTTTAIGGKTGLDVQSTRSKVITLTPTVSTASYATGDQVGSLLTLTNALRDDSATGVLQSVTICDGSQQNAELDIYIFNSSPTITSTDNGAASVTNSDLSKCVAVYNISAASYRNLNTNSVGSAQNNEGVVIDTEHSSGDLFALIVTRSAQVYTASDALTVHVGILQD